MPKKLYSILPYVLLLSVSFCFMSTPAAAELTCWDCNLTYLAYGYTDALVNVQDLNAMVDYINNNKESPLMWIIRPTNPWFDAIFDLNGDGLINIGDLNALVDFVNNNRSGSLWVVNCNVCGC